FFAALAMGRPVLFHGSERSDVAHWVRELKLGKVLSEANWDEVLQYLSDCLSDKDRLREDQQRAHEAYKRHFAKDTMVKEFERVLKGLNAEC
ncbi:MAG: glycosyltransferase family 4 protein, partial [Lentisphaerae bacterium]|nr:glycosyltransferase family 4 protein [Lentisphaerota bacterium]